MPDASKTPPTPGIAPGVTPTTENEPKPPPAETTPVEIIDLLQLPNVTTTAPGAPGAKPEKPTTVADLLVSSRSVYQGSGAPTVVDLSGAGQAPTLRTGELVFHPSFSTRAYLEDNFFATPTNPRPSAILTYIPSIDLNFGTQEALSAHAGASFDYHDSLTNVVKDYFNLAATGGIRVKHFFLDELTLSFDDAYTQVGNTIVNPLAEPIDISNLEIVPNARYETNSTPTSLVYKSDRLQLGLGYTNTLTNYFSSKLAADNYDQNLGTFNCEYKVLGPNLSVTGSYAKNLTEFPEATLSNFDLNSVSAGVKGHISTLEYQFSGGVDTAGFDSDATDTEPTYSASLLYKPSGRFSLQVLSSRNLTFGVLTGKQLNNSFGTVLTFKPAEHALLTFSYGRNDQQRTSGRESDSSASGNLQYDFGPNLQTRTGIQYLDQQLLDGTSLKGFLESAQALYKMGQFAVATASATHEDLARQDHTRQITTVYTAAFNMKVRYWATADFSFNHTERKDTQIPGLTVVNDLRFGFKVSW